MLKIAAVYWSCALLLIITVIKIHAHPQCLDYFPPFTSSRPVGFCKETSNYGCCSSTRESNLRQIHKFAVRMRKRTNSLPSCDKFVKEILCSECHPYAAHIYDAENPSKKKQQFSKSNERFPGLCYEFCLESFQSCRYVLLALPLRDAFRKFLTSVSAKKFCTWAIPNDKDYCYPKVNNINSLQFKKDENKLVTTMCVQPVAFDLYNPILATHSNDGSHRLFVGEQRGVIHIIDHKGRKLKTPFLNITNRILNSGQGWDERGFLGFAFHPKYATNGRFFVYYSVLHKDYKANKTKHWFASPKHKIRIAEYIVSPDDPNLADHSSEITLLEIDEPEANHEGGMLLFGDDGFLYIFVGDGGGAGDRHWTFGNSQNMTNLLGKALRIDVDVYDGRRYAIPPDNPFRRMTSARKEIYAYGLRNTWRCSKDRGNVKTKAGKGRIFCGDVGQDKYEEIDIITKGGNYGWRVMEGNHCYDEDLCDSKDFDKGIPPIIAYDHSIGKSIVGGYVYRGCNNPNMQGLYFYADTVSGRIFSAKEDPKAKTWKSKEVVMGNSSICNNALFGSYAETILSFGEDEAGEIYILSAYWPSASRPLGVLYKLVDPTRRDDPETCKFEPKTPKPLKRVQKRRIDKNSNKRKGHKKYNCVDKKKFCRNVLAFPFLCKTFEAVTKVQCKKSCGYC